MSDLKYTVEVTGLKDVEQLEKNLDRLHNTLNAGQGSGRSLEEMRKILVGMRGQSSIISDLRDSVKGLNSAAEQLGASFDSGFKQLDRTFKQGFQLVLDRVNMFGAEVRKDLPSGVKGAFDAGAQAAAGGGKRLSESLQKSVESAGKAASASIAKTSSQLESDVEGAAARARKAATKVYDNLVGGDGTLKLSKAVAEQVEELRVAGATISKYHATTLEHIRKAAETAAKRAKDSIQEPSIRKLLRLPDPAETAKQFSELKQDIISRYENTQKEIAAATKLAKDSIQEPSIRKLLRLPDPAETAKQFSELKQDIISRYENTQKEIAAATKLAKDSIQEPSIRKLLRLPDPAETAKQFSELKQDIISRYENTQKEIAAATKLAKDSIQEPSIRKLLRLPDPAETAKQFSELKQDIISRYENTQKEIAAATKLAKDSIQEPSIRKLLRLPDPAETAKQFSELKQDIISRYENTQKEIAAATKLAKDSIQEPSIRKLLRLPDPAETAKQFSELKQDIISRYENTQKEIAAATKLAKDSIQEPSIRKLLRLPDPAEIQQEFRNLELQIKNHYKQLDELKKQLSKPAGVYTSLDTRELVGSQQQLKEYHKSLQTQMQSHEQVVDDLRSKALNKQRIADQVFLEAQKGHTTKVASLRSQQAKESTAAYSKLVEFDPAKKLTPQLAEELSMLKRHGASLSQWHNEIINEYRQYGTLYLQEMDKLAAKKQRKLDAEAAKAAKAANATAATGLGVAPGLAVAGNPAPMLAYANSVDKVRDAQDKLRGSLRGLAIDGNDTHSAMRGLASGFNLLWLTWGNLAPLFGGAAISNGFMQTAKQGMEVAHTLEVVAALGENSTKSMGDLTSELIRLGHNGPRGPLEIAEAIKTLSLAGLEANKILAVTGTVLNFSTSGTTSLQTAADVLVSVTTAFGTGAAGFERSADIITRAAADSKASVESFGEAMKTASVAGEQYGAKQEDVALLIQLLAQVGIQGSAAGTSVRNMYADITGRSGQVGKILESLKLDFKDLDGNVVSTVEQMRMLDEVLKQYDSKSQGNIIQAIYGERGAKAAIAALQAYRTAAQDSSKYANKLEEDFAKVANAAADSAIAAAKLGQTSQKAFETAGATMRTTMFEAFREIEPQLYMTAVAFQEAFGSAETRELLQSMTSAVATLGMAVAENLEPIAKVAILWAEYRLALFAVNNVLAASAALKQSYAAVTKALTAATVADTTATALNNAAKASPALAGAAAGRALYTANLTASTGAVLADTTATAANTRAKQANQLATAGIGMTVLKALPVVGNAIALASVAWMVFKSATDDAGSAVENYAQTKSDKIAEKLEQEAEHLRRVNEERLKGIGLMEAEARVRESYDREASVADLTTEEDKLRSKLNNLNALKENIEKSTRKGDQGVLDAVVNNIQATDAALTAAMVSRAAAEDRFDRAAAERRKRTKESNDIAVKEASDQAKQLKDALEKGVGGLKTWSLTDFQGGGKGGGAGGNSFVDLNRDKELQALKAHYDAELAVANDYYNKSKQLLDGHRSANLISEEDYLVQSLQLSRSHEAEQLQVLEASLTAYTEASERRKAALESQMSGAKGKGKSMLLDQLKKETQEFEIFVTNYEKERAKVAAESYARVGETVLKLQTEVGKLLKSSEDFWDNAAVSSAAQKDADELAEKYKNMNTSILSMDSAMFEFEKAQKSTQSEVKKMNAALEKQLSIQKNLLQIELLSLKAAQASGRLTLDEAIQRATLISQFKEGIAELEGQIADNTEKGLELGAERGWEAFQKMREKQVEELANSMSEAVVGGLMSGDYKSIGKNIRDILQRELIRKPLTAIINGVLQVVVGSMMGAAGGASGAQQFGGGGSLDFMNLSGALGGTIASLGSKFGIQAAESFGMGLQGITLDNAIAGTYGGTAFNLGSTIGGWDKSISKVPGFEGGFGSVLGYGKAIFDLTEGNYGSSIGTAIGTYILPGIGTAIGSAIGSLVDDMFGGSPYYGGDAVSVGGKQSWTGKHGGGYDSGVGKFFGPYAQGISAVLTDLLKEDILVKIGFDENEKRARAYLNIHATSGNIGVSRSGVSVAKGEEGAKEAINLVAKEAFTLLLANGGLTSLEKKLVEAANAAGGTYENLISVYSQIKEINAGFSQLGQTMAMFSGISDDMKIALLEAFGSIQGVAEVAGSYYQNFYSEEERLRKAGETVNAALKSIGVELDVFGGAAAKVKYRELVEKAFAEGDQELAAQLLQLSAAFSDVANAAEQASVATKEAARALEEAAKSAAKFLVDNALANLEAAVSRITDNLKEQISTLSEAVDAHKSLGDVLKRTVMELRNDVQSTSQWSAARGMVYIENALSKVRGGSNILDFKDLEDAISAARGGITNGAYVSQFERDRDALVLAGQLEELDDLNGEQLSVAEKQLKILKDQLAYYEEYLRAAREMVDGVDTLIDKTLSPEQAYAILLKAMSEAAGAGKGDLQLDDYLRRKADALTDPAAAAKQQLIKDTAKSFEGSGDSAGLWKAIKAVGGNEYDLNALYGWSIEDLRKVIAGIEAPPKKPSEGAVFGPGTSTTGTSNSAQSDYNSRFSSAVLGGDAAKTQMDIHNAAKQYEGSGDVSGLWGAVSAAGGNQYDLANLYGWNVNDIEKVLNDMGVPGFSQGINVVPHDMLAQIHEGEAIIPKRYNPYLPGHGAASGGGSGELASELRSLHQTIHELKEEVTKLKDAAARTAKNTEGVQQLVDQFDEVTEGGNVLRTEVV